MIFSEKSLALGCAWLLTWGWFLGLLVGSLTCWCLRCLAAVLLGWLIGGLVACFSCLVGWSLGLGAGWLGCLMAWGAVRCCRWLCLVAAASVLNPSSTRITTGPWQRTPNQFIDHLMTTSLNISQPAFTRPCHSGFEVDYIDGWEPPTLYRMEVQGLACLQEAAEALIVSMMEEMNHAAIHAKRVTIMLKDMALVTRLSGTNAYTNNMSLKVGRVEHEIWISCKLWK